LNVINTFSVVVTASGSFLLPKAVHILKLVTQTDTF